MNEATRILLPSPSKPEMCARNYSHMRPGVNPNSLRMLLEHMCARSCVTHENSYESCVCVCVEVKRIV